MDLKKEFSKIYDRYVEKIYRFIFIKVNSPEVAEDLTSETFLKGWESFKNENSQIKNPSAFLYKIARNLVNDYYREKKKVNFISTENTSLIDPRQDLEEKAMLDSDMKTIRMALAGLKEEYQNVLIWYYIDGLSLSEVAKLLDRTEEATRVLISRALKSLKEKITQV